jgi:hypothetical protein
MADRKPLPINVPPIFQEPDSRSHRPCPRYTDSLNACMMIALAWRVNRGAFASISPGGNNEVGMPMCAPRGVPRRLWTLAGNWQGEGVYKLELLPLEEMVEKSGERRRWGWHRWSSVGRGWMGWTGSGLLGCYVGACNMRIAEISWGGGVAPDLPTAVFRYLLVQWDSRKWHICTRF